MYQHKALTNEILKHELQREVIPDGRLEMKDKTLVWVTLFLPLIPERGFMKSCPFQLAHAKAQSLLWFLPFYTQITMVNKAVCAPFKGKV